LAEIFHMTHVPVTWWSRQDECDVVM